MYSELGPRRGHSSNQFREPKGAAKIRGSEGSREPIMLCGAAKHRSAELSATLYELRAAVVGTMAQCWPITSNF